MPENKKRVVVFLRNPDNECKIKQYASDNKLEILYAFGKNGSSSSGTSITIRKVFKESLALLMGKRRFKKGLFIRVIKKIKESFRTFRRRYTFEDRLLLATIEYLTQYKECQGLLVFDIKDVCPRDLSVVRWVIDKVRALNKEVYSVISYTYDSLPRWDNNLELNLSRKWNEIIESIDFQYKRCPPIVSICVFENKCFCKCRFCYQMKNPEAVIEEYMDFDLFKKIINDIPPDERLCIVLGPGGEPLTYPKLHKMVRYVSDTRPLAITEYSTNGIMMDRENCLKIIESGLKRIMVSLNAPTREDYKWFTGVDAYDRVVSNMIELMKLRSKLRSPTPIVKTKIMGMKRWADKIEGFIRYWSNIVDEAIISPVSYYQDEDLENIDSLKPSANPLVPACFYLTNNMIIMPNGRFQICCAPDFAGEKYGPIDPGNSRDRNLIDVWCSKEYTELRKVNASGLPIFANCLTCNINRPDFESDLLVKAKQRRLLGMDK